MSIITKKETIEFIKEYFKSGNIKNLIVYTLFFFIFISGTGKEDVDIWITLLIIIIIGVIKHLIMPNYLYKETIEDVERYYNDGWNNEQELSLICNIKKLDGPMFGVLTIDDRHMKFMPFKENLKNEEFFVNIEDIKVSKIEIINFKHSIFNRLFFKGLAKGIVIPIRESEIYIQVPKVYDTYNSIVTYLREE